jgi:hypothetical protein
MKNKDTKIALLRVGADSGNLGFHSPLFNKSDYDFIPIPEDFNDSKKSKGKKIDDKEKYTNTIIRRDEYLIKYFPDKKGEKYKNKVIHNDPEFINFTYGDPSPTKVKIGKFMPGDYLLLYCSLEDKRTNKVALYLFAYFVVESAKIVKDLGELNHLKKMGFRNNMHVKHKFIFERDVTTPKNGGLKLVKGDDKKSKVLKEPKKISEIKAKYKKSKNHLVLSKDMQKIFGNLGGKISIQRNALRFIERAYVAGTIKWLNKLK